jgi:hypothetical protein
MPYSPDDISIINYSISIQAAEDALEAVNDAESQVDSFQTVRFLRDADAVHYRLKFSRILRLAAREWTMAFDGDARGWIRGCACDAEIRDWVYMLFISPSHRQNFENAIKLSVPGVEVWEVGAGDAEPLR